MARTTLDFEYEGINYSLAFTVDSLKRLEKNGFSFGRIEDHMLSATEDLFYAAFEANHTTTPRRVREKIYKEFSDKSGDDNVSLNDALFEMVSEAIEAMKPKGNVKWKVTKG